MSNISEDFDKLTSDIRGAIDGEITGTGFHAMHCPMCGSKEKKAGFKFEPNSIIYNCFRGKCDATTVYTMGEFVPRKFKALMEVLGVEIPVSLSLAGRKRNKLFTEKLDESLYKKNTYKDFQLPDGLIPIEEESSGFFQGVIERRKVITRNLWYQTEGMYRGSLAIPIRYYDKVIGIEYYTRGGNYITISNNEHVIFCKETQMPKKILLVEGMFDALCFPNTVATKRSNLSPEQAYHLRDREIIVLPDRKGSKLYQTAKDYGFKVCIPMWEEKDLNAFVMKYGMMIAARQIHENVMEVGRKSDLLYKQWTTKANDKWS